MLDVLETTKTPLQLADSITDAAQEEATQVVSETNASQFAVADIAVSKASINIPQINMRMSAAQSGAVSPSDFTSNQTQNLAKEAIGAMVDDVANPVTSTTAEDLDFAAVNAVQEEDNSFVIGLYTAVGGKPPEILQELMLSYTPEEAERIEAARKKLSADVGEEITLEQLYNMDPEAHGRALTNDISNAFAAYYMQELNDSIGWSPESWTDFGKTQDLFQLLIPGITAVQRSDVADIWNVDLVGENSVQSAVVAFNALPPAQKALIFPILARGIDEQAAVFGESNIFLTMSRLAEFLDPSKLNDGYFEVGLDVGLGAVDVLAFTSFFIKAMKANATIARGPSFLKNFGNKTKAGELNALALTDETGKATPSTATPQDVAAANTAGFNYKKNLFDPVATDDIAANTVAATEAQERALVQFEAAAIEGGRKVDQIGELAKELKVTGRGVVRPDERAAAGAFILDNFSEMARRHNLDANIVSGYNPRIVGETQDGFLIDVTVGKKNPVGTDVMTVSETGEVMLPEEAQLAIAADKPYITERVEIKMTQDALTGEFATTTLGLRGTKLGRVTLSPSAFLGRLTVAGDDLVSASTAAGLQKGKLRKTFGRMIGVAYRGVSKESKEQLDSILIAGDEFINDAGARVGKVYTREELATGVPTQDGLIRMSDPADQDSYYAIREIFNITRAITDEQLVSRMRFNGIEETTLPIAKVLNPSHTRVAVKPVRDTSHLNIREVLDTTSGKSMLFESKEYQQAIEQGNMLVKIQGNPVVVTPIGKGAKGYSHMLIKEGTTKPVTSVLRQHTGYVPVIRENVHFVARGHVKAVVDGVPTTVSSGVRLFDNEKEAQIWAAANSTPRRPINVVASDSEGFISTGLSDEIEELQYGGNIFTSPRSQRQVLFGKDGDRPVRANVAKAMDRNLAHVAKNMAYNNFRMQSINKWHNTAMKAWDASGTGALSNPSDWLSPIRANVPTVVRNGLETTRDYLKSVLNLETPDERFVSRALGDAAAYIEGAYGDGTFMGKAVPAKLREASLNLRHKDATAFLRAISFHALLGGFNPSSGVIQMMGAAPAISMHPVFGAKAFAQYQAVRSFFFAKDVVRAAETGDKFYAKILQTGFDSMPKGLFSSSEEMGRILEEIKETGLLDAVKTQADYAASLQGYGVGRGSWKKLLDSGTVFFNEGEMFARGLSYLVARQEMAKKMGFDPAKALTPDQFNAVLDRSRNLTLNLDVDNAAVYQKGAIGVPMQFFQITGKTVESILGLNPGLKGDFTRVRAVGGQLLFFGSRGIPILTAAGIAAAVKGMYGEDAMDDMSEEERIALEGGLASYIIYASLGADINIASRASLAEGITNAFVALSKEKVDMTKAVLGAFGVVPQRMLDATRKTVWLYSSFDQESPVGLTSEKVLFALEQYASVFSSVRNSLIGRALLSDDGWRDPETGELLISADDVNTTEAWFQVLGFRPRVADTAYVLSMSEQQRKQAQKEVTDSIANAYNFFLNRNESKNEFDEKDAENLAITVGTLLRTFPRHMRTELFTRGFDRAVATDSRVSKFVNRYIEDKMSGVKAEESFFAPTSVETIAIPKKKEE